mmetsp:Transcript_715/g.971  ORF Transcript_715/g.971 Transcript_715/m.971 type:complete len:90 (-) Transcript_715:1183-1452(-)
MASNSIPFVSGTHRAVKSTAKAHTPAYTRKVPIPSSLVNMMENVKVTTKEQLQLNPEAIDEPIPRIFKGKISPIMTQTIAPAPNEKELM